MGNKLKVEIIETAGKLKQQLGHQKTGQEKERLPMRALAQEWSSNKPSRIGSQISSK
jgi:hypothetical protein